MNDGEKLVRTYSDDKNMMMLKMKYHENKEMMSLIIIVARTYWWCIFYPSPLLTDSNGSEVCSDVVFHVNTNHSNNLNTPFFSNFINFEYVHLALDPGHPEVRKGWDDITKWRKPSNFETVKPNTSNSFEQSIWSYRHFWALEFVSTKDTKKTSILHQKDKISSHLSVLLKATPLLPSSIL